MALHHNDKKNVNKVSHGFQTNEKYVKHLSDIESGAHCNLIEQHAGIHFLPELKGD